MKLKFQKLNPNATLPVYATSGSAGMDLSACLDEAVVLQSGEAAAIPTGVAMELPDSYEAQVRGRSGLAFKNAIFAFPGTIDADYRGEIKVLLINHSRVPFTVYPGMRIAQIIINAAVVKCRPEWADELDTTERGEGGFGSTGVDFLIDKGAYGDDVYQLCKPNKVPDQEEIKDKLFCIAIGSSGE